MGSKKDHHEPGAPHQELKKQVEGLNESLFKVESQRDEFGVKVELLEKQLEESQAKEAELQVRCFFGSFWNVFKSLCLNIIIYCVSFHRNLRTRP